MKCARLAAYDHLRRTGSYKKGVGSPRMVIVVHGSGHVQSHQLQAGDEAGQGAVARLLHRVGPGVQEAARAGRDAVLRV